MAIKFLTPKEIMLHLFDGDILRESIASKEYSCYYKFDNNIFWWRIYHDGEWMIIKDTNINSFVQKNLLVDSSQRSYVADQTMNDFGFGDKF